MIKPAKTIKKSAGQIVAESVLGKKYAQQVFTQIQNKAQPDPVPRALAVEVRIHRRTIYIAKCFTRVYNVWLPKDRNVKGGMKYRQIWFHEDGTRVSDALVRWYVLGYLCLGLKPRPGACQHLKLSKLQQSLERRITWPLWARAPSV